MEKTVSTEKKSRRGLYAVITIVIIAIVAHGVVLYYWFFIKPQVIPWLFKGAYAEYYGETTILFLTVKVKVRLEVVDYNATHAKLLTYMKIETPLGSQESQNVTWSNLNKKSYDVEGYNLKRTCEQETYIEGIGTRTCIVYEYESKTTSGDLTVMYVDKNIGWPVKIKFSSKATQSKLGISLDLTVTESNIPGLEK